MRRDDKSAIGRVCKSRDRILTFIPIMHLRCGYLSSKRWRGRLRGAPECDMCGCFRVHQYQDTDDAGRDFFEQFDPLPAHGRLEASEASHVAAWARHAFDKAALDRGSYLNEHDRNRLCQLVNRLYQ